MCARRRSEKTRSRNAERRAAALAQVPQMLAREQALRDQLNDLHRKTKAVASHARYDKEIAGVVSDWEQVRASLVSELSALPELIGSIMLQGETGRCSALRQRVEKVERLKDRAGELGEKLVELSIARAGLGVVPVNSDEMASQIDAMAEFFDIIEAGIQQHRATLNSICPESSELSDHAG